MRALVPGGLFTSYGRLYMTFRSGAFQYGSTGLVLETNLGDATMTARARFFTLAPYTARAGLLTIRAGESTVEYGPMSGTKDGRTYTVPGPPTRTTLDAGRVDAVPVPRLDAPGAAAAGRGARLDHAAPRRGLARHPAERRRDRPGPLEQRRDRGAYLAAPRSAPSGPGARRSRRARPVEDHTGAATAARPGSRSSNASA